LTGGDGNPRGPPHARHHRRVVVPVTRLLEPADVEGLDEVGEANRVRGRPPAVGVDGENEVRAGGPPCRLDAPGVLVRRQAADLELAPGHAGEPVGFHLAPDVRVRLAVHVIAADGAALQLAPVAAAQLTRALADALAVAIPDRAIHLADAFEQ